MLFDQLCRLVEERFPEKRKLLDEARIFRLERVYKRESSPGIVSIMEVIRNHSLGWEPDMKVVQNIRLPFPTVAIEEATSRDAKGTRINVLSEISPESDVKRYDTIMLDESLLIMAEVESSFAECLDVMVGKPMRMRNVVVFDAVHNLLVAEAQVLEGPPKAEQFERVMPTTVAERLEMLEKTERQVRDTSLAVAWESGLIATLSVVLICSPTNFVVEETNSDVEKKFGREKIRRSRYRPHYIVLNPQQIKHRFIRHESHADGGERHNAPHERRGHFRHLTGERWKAKAGQTIWVKPTWVGPETGVVGKNTYRVRLDL